MQSRNEKKIVDFDTKLRIRTKLKKSSLKIPNLKRNQKLMNEVNFYESDEEDQKSKKKYSKYFVPYLSEDKNEEISNSIVQIKKDLEFLSYRAYAFNKFKSEESKIEKSILKSFIGEENLNKIIGEQNNGFYFSQKRTINHMPILKNNFKSKNKNHVLHTQENDSDLVKLLDNKFIDSEYPNSYDFLGNYNLKQLSKAALFNESKIDSLIRTNSKSVISRNFNYEKDETDRSSSKNKNFSTNTNSQNFDVKDSFIIKEKNNFILRNLNSQDSIKKNESDPLKMKFISKFAKMIGIKEVIEENEKNTDNLNKMSSVLSPKSHIKQDSKDYEYEIKNRRLTNIINEQKSMFKNIKMIENFNENNNNNQIEHNEVKRDLNNKLKIGVDVINSKTKNIAKLIFSKIKKNLIKKSNNKLIDLNSIMDEENQNKSDKQLHTSNFTSTLILPSIPKTREKTITFNANIKSSNDVEPIKEGIKKRTSKYLIETKNNSIENVEKYLKAHENEQKKQIINNLSDYASEKKLIIELESFKKLYENIKSKQLAYAERYTETSYRYSNMLLDKEKDLILIEKLKVEIEKLDYNINNFGKSNFKNDKNNINNKLDVIDLFTKRKELTFKLEEINDRIKSNQGFINVSLFMKESYAFDINRLESELEEISENINIISIKICTYYYKLMSIGIDMRENGIIWLFKEIWKLGYDIILSKLPKFMDRQLIEYCFIYAHKENVLNSHSSLKENVIKIIANLKGIEVRVSNFNKRIKFTKRDVKRSYRDFISGKYLSPSESGSIQDQINPLKISTYKPVIINNKIESLNHKSISGLFFNYEHTLTKTNKDSYENNFTTTPSIFSNYLTSLIEIDKKTLEISSKLIEDIQISKEKEIERMSYNFLNKNYGKIYQTSINQILSIICGSKNIRKEIKVYEEKSHKVNEQIKQLRFYNN